MVHPVGAWSIVLHAHLPFVYHPDHDVFLEEDWYCEAMSEVYLPLLDKLERLVAAVPSFRITISLSPTLLAMWDNEVLRHKYARYVQEHIELCQQEQKRYGSASPYFSLAKTYEDHYRYIRELHVEQHKGDVLLRWRRLADSGCVELITTAATHAYLPLWQKEKDVLHWQVGLGISEFVRLLGRKPSGFWFPECGYMPGFEQVCAQWGVSYFVVDTHGLLQATPPPVYGTFAPMMTPVGVAALGRDAWSARQVWSAQEGFPGAYAYRDFYEAVKHDVHRRGCSAATGIKYHRVSYSAERKDLYDPELAYQLAVVHADIFWTTVKNHLQEARHYVSREPLMVSCYDAELFGHWWYEGPEWLEKLFVFSGQRPSVRMVTVSEYLQCRQDRLLLQYGMPYESSWGWKGYHEMWMCGENDWIYLEVIDVVRRWRSAKPDSILQKRAYDQALREWLLAQSSDWAFLLKTGTAATYARKRVEGHVEAAKRLLSVVEDGKDPEGWVGVYERQNPLFLQEDLAAVAAEIRAKMS